MNSLLVRKSAPGLRCTPRLQTNYQIYWKVKLLPAFDGEQKQPGSETPCVKQGEVGKQDIGQWDMGRWSRAYEGGRYLACCWNLVPPTGNYRAVSLPVTTAVLRIGPDSTHKSPHTHVSAPAQVLSLPRSEGARPDLGSFVSKRNLTLHYFDEQFIDNPPEVMWAVLIRK